MQERLQPSNNETFFVIGKNRFLIIDPNNKISDPEYNLTKERALATFPDNEVSLFHSLEDAMNAEGPQLITGEGIFVRIPKKTNSEKVHLFQKKSYDYVDLIKTEAVFEVTVKNKDDLKECKKQIEQLFEDEPPLSSVHYFKTTKENIKILTVQCVEYGNQDNMIKKFVLNSDFCEINLEAEIEEPAKSHCCSIL